MSARRFVANKAGVVAFPVALESNVLAGYVKASTPSTSKREVPAFPLNVTAKMETLLAAPETPLAWELFVGFLLMLIWG